MVGRRTRRRLTAGFEARAGERLPESREGVPAVATEPDIGAGRLSHRRTERLAAGLAGFLAVCGQARGGSLSTQRKGKSRSVAWSTNTLGGRTNARGSSPVRRATSLPALRRSR